MNWHGFARLSGWTCLAWLWLLAILSVACQTQPNQVFIEVDGGRQALTSQAATVREALAEANVELGPLDRVKPDLYTQLEPGLAITIIRVKEEIETKREIVPFERQTITNEALGMGETRVSQLGVNGEDEITIRVVYENGAEVSRTEVSRATVIQPVPEILVVGPQGELPSTPIEGTIAYIANGNAWLMRDSSGSRRPLTTAGDLDGRVFSLSPDGRQLLYTRALSDEIDLPLNEVWLASTTIVGEAPITLGLQGVLYAEWSPVISQPLLAYSTAERTASSPGWRANNDLWLYKPSRPPLSGEAKTKAVEVIPPNTQGLYPWWGTSFAWSPEGVRLAYARADQIGVIDLKTESPVSYTITPLVDFVPLKTFSDWVWLPGLSWSPDGQFLAAVVHGPPQAGEPAEESQVFDLWLFGLDNDISAKVSQQVGMWANPAWGKMGIAFGAAMDPLQSATGRYFIKLIDRDGSNPRQLFPFREELGVQLPQLVWSPEGETLLFTYNGNLYMIEGNGTPPKQLTADGQASHPQWVSAAPLMTSLTSTTTLTGSGSITPSAEVSPTQVIPVTPAPTSDLAVTPTQSITRSVTSTVTLTATPIPITPPVSPAVPTIPVTDTATITPSQKLEENEGTEPP
ncbi:MAG: G5 domain-containing protein [Anaerolineae bacterium]|nr:G5 domain-containing protein [Anaerolineae bacterium]